MRGLAALAVGLLAAGAALLALGGPARGGDRQPDAAAGGRAVFARMGCGSCHRLAAGAGAGTIGPDLDAVLPGYDTARLRAQIVEPYAAGPSESFATMPQDYGTRMSATELDELVGFLLGATRR